MEWAAWEGFGGEMVLEGMCSKGKPYRISQRCRGKTSPVESPTRGGSGDPTSISDGTPRPQDSVNTIASLLFSH